MRSAGLDEAQAGMKMAGRHIHPLRYAHDRESVGGLMEKQVDVNSELDQQILK